MLRSIPASLMRGGTSRGLYFAADDLPSDTATRDKVLIAAMGAPHPRQVDGVGGAHPLTSKVAVLSRSSRQDADIDYLFLQVWPDRAAVSDNQNCGNILAGVGPWAVDNGIVPAVGDSTPVRIHMVNTGTLAVAHVPTPGGVVEYEGETTISGVPGTAAAIPIDFLDVAGSSCGALLPTGNAIDTVLGIEVTCIDNGMPAALLRAADFGLSGDESPADLEANEDLKQRVEDIRLEIGPKMNLGDVTDKTVPKMTLLSPPVAHGVVNTRSFIPHRVHESIGVLAAVSVATACALPGSVAATIADIPAQSEQPLRLDVEHPTGFFSVEIDSEMLDGALMVKRAALIRTARLLMRGELFVPSSAWAAK